MTAPTCFAFRAVLLISVTLGLADAQIAVDSFKSLRLRMVKDDIESRGVKNPAVLAAISTVPRERFVSESMRSQAYEDRPLPIGFDQTISQPYIVALMTELLGPEKHHRVLEIGTGSGYQAAVLSDLVDSVYSIELIPELAQSAASILKKLGYNNVFVRAGDGYRGWPEKAPFDRIILTAAPPSIPQELLDQLKPGGKLVAPVGVESQELVVIDKSLTGKTTVRSIIPVRFVPMKREGE